MTSDDDNVLPPSPVDSWVDLFVRLLVAVAGVLAFLWAPSGTDLGLLASLAAAVSFIGPFVAVAVGVRMVRSPLGVGSFEKPLGYAVTAGASAVALFASYAWYLAVTGYSFA